MPFAAVARTKDEGKIKLNACCGRRGENTLCHLNTSFFLVTVQEVKEVSRKFLR